MDVQWTYKDGKRAPWKTKYGIKSNCTSAFFLLIRQKVATWSRVFKSEIAKRQRSIWATKWVLMGDCADLQVIDPYVKARGINSLSVASKLFPSITLHPLINIHEKHIHENPAGFLPSQNCTHQISTLQQILEHRYMFADSRSPSPLIRKRRSSRSVV